MKLHLTHAAPSRAAVSLDDATLNAACQLTARIACRVVRQWTDEQYADAFGCYRMTAPRVWTDWAASDVRHLGRLFSYGDAFLIEWRIRRGRPHGSTKGLWAARNATNEMEVFGPSIQPSTRVPPPWTGPQGFYLCGTVYRAHQRWLCAVWDRQAKTGTLPVWTGRKAPDWYAGLAGEVEP